MWPRRGAASLALILSVPAAWAQVVAQTSPPTHMEGSVTGPIVETPEAMRVTNTIQCWCGGCVNQTLHECTCGLAASERNKVAEALAGGRTPEELIAAYVAEHGEQVRIVPEKRGLDLIGWLVPFAAAAAGLVALLIVLAGWRRREASRHRALAGGPVEMTAPDERRYRERLEHDLRESGR